MATSNASVPRKRSAASMLDQRPNHIKSQPYNVDVHEIKHKLVTSKPEWKAFQDGKQYIYRLISNTYLKYTDINNIPLKIVEELRVAVKDAKQQDIVVAVDGTPGSGKSSTLNALFSVGAIAVKGKGCSNAMVPIEYTMSHPAQKLPYRGEVLILPSNKRRELLADELATFFMASNQKENDARLSSSCNKPVESANVNILDGVVENIYTTFCNKLECSTKAATWRFLDSATSEHDSKLVDKMVGWLDAMIEETAIGSTSIVYEAFTIGDLHHRLGVYTTKPSNEQSEPTPTLWLFTYLIRVHFDSALTRLGVKFVDFPSPPDERKHRQQNILIHRDRCTHFAYIVNPVHAMTACSNSIATRASRSHCPERMVVILTRSDAVGEEDMMNKGSPAEQTEILHLKNQVQQLKKEVATLDMQESTTDVYDVGHSRLCEVQREYEARLRLAENAEKAFCIQMRSEMDIKEVQTQLRAAFHATNDTPVFYISNTCYKQHQDGFLAKHTPTLSVEESGVPSLRRWFAEIPNAAHLLKIRSEHTKRIPDLLNRLERTLGTSPVKGIETLKEHAIKPYIKCEELLNDVYEKFSERMLEKVFTALMLEQADWIRQAKLLVSNLCAEETHAKFLILMKRSGLRLGTGEKRYSVNLNEDLGNIKAKFVVDVFDKVGVEHLQLGEDLFQAWDSLCNDMSEDIRKDPSADSVKLKPFFTRLGTESPRFREAVRVAMGELWQWLLTIRRKISLVEHDAYVVRAMQPIYADISNLTGHRPFPGAQKKRKPLHGFHQERMRVFKERVSATGGVWASMCKQAKAEFLAVSKRSRMDLVDRARDTSGDIHTAFLELCEPADREAKLRAEVKESLAKAKEHLAGPMAAAVKALEADFS